MNCLVVHKGKILNDNLNWKDPDYAGKISQLDLFTEVEINNFNEMLGRELKINDYLIKNPYVKTEVIAEDKYYVYEMMYIDLIQEKDYHQPEMINDLATLLSIDGDLIFSDAIIIKSHVSPNQSIESNENILENMTREDIKKILYDRAYTKVVVWDEHWREDRVVGSMEDYAKRFFEEEKYQTVEIAFLMYNINIWYTYSDFGETNLCGKLLNNNKKIDKCIIYTNQSDQHRGCICLDEVDKIIKLSIKLHEIGKDTKTPEECAGEKLDETGRRIIYNKIRVLDYVYKNNFEV